MPTRPDLTWEKSKNRWKKIYKGKPYWISCYRLGCEPTKEASYQAANAWWLEKKAEIDNSTPLSPLIRELSRRRDWSVGRGEARLAADHEKAISEARSWKKDDLVVEGNRISLPTSEVWDRLGPSAEIWQDRLERDAPEAIPQDLTVAGQIVKRLEQLKALVHAGGLSAGSFANSRDCLNHFRDWIGGANLPTKINADTLEDFHRFLLGKIGERRADPLGKAGWSRDYSLKIFGNAKSLISYLAGKGVIPLPPNFASKGFQFGSGAKKIVTFTTDEARMLIEKASGQLRLHLLLMCNCGMTQVDISDLKDVEVDWENGRITRKRSKTAEEKNTPTVSYKLWVDTFRLLKEYRSGKATVLLTKSGGLWAWEELGREGKVRSSDNIATNYNRLRKKLGLSKSLKIFRKTSATLIEGSQFRHFRPLFLGHAPQGIGEIHYADHSPEQFDEAVRWLGVQYGY